MLTVAEALERVLAHAAPLAALSIASRDALGLVLAEEVASDIDSPPYDKSIVDGYAIVAADLAGGAAELTILEEVVAGALPTLRVESGFASRIMTGAAIPDGADAVVMVERTELLGEGSSSAMRANATRVRIDDIPPKSGQNIMRQATSLRRGDVVLRRGSLLRSVELGVLAEIGATSVSVLPRPRVAVLATGNELVAADRSPAPGQIRNSNGPMLAAAIAAAGGVPHDLGIARDDAGELTRLVDQGLESDVLLLSGGVSMGVLDLVPGVFHERNVREVFHKISLKPGKPLWFGVSAHQPAKLVFGLPGNPVSTYVCFALFVLPALQQLAGKNPIGMPRVAAKLTAPFEHRGDRPTYHPAFAREVAGSYEVQIVPWHGSGDLASVAGANALIEFAAGTRSYAAGDEINVLLL